MPGETGNCLFTRLVAHRIVGKLGNQAQMDMQLYPGEVRVLPVGAFIWLCYNNLPIKW